METLTNLTENEKLLFSIIKSMRKEYSKKIEALEKHQLLLYHQSALYQNSRDITKNIFYYLYKYFGLMSLIIFFKKIEAVIDHLEKNRKNENLSKEKNLK